MTQSISPFFSLVIPTYNRAEFIVETINSVLEQTFDNFEIIVVDDGSTDHTESVIGSLSDPRIRYYKKENGERGAARNFGISKSKGVWISFLDSDDILYPSHFQFASEKINESNGSFIGLAHEMKDYHSRKLISRNKIKSGIQNKELLKGNFLSCIGVFVKKEVFEIVRFNEERKLSGTEDWLLWLQISARHNLHFYSETTSCMLNHENRSVLNYSEEELLYRTNILMANLREDKVFTERFGERALPKIKAHMLSYSSLHLAMSRKKPRAIDYFCQAILEYPLEFFSRRTLGILKSIISN